jgi:CheY-like chemotaxis protein
MAETQDGTMGKILVAEDDEDLAVVILSALELQGYRVHHVRNADLVLPALYSFNPRLLVTDLMMPSQHGVDGVELIRQIRSNPALAHMRILACSAITSESHISAATIQDQLGVDAFLPKPFEVDALLGKIEKLLSKE